MEKFAPQRLRSIEFCSTLRRVREQSSLQSLDWALQEFDACSNITDQPQNHSCFHPITCCYCWWQVLLQRLVALPHPSAVPIPSLALLLDSYYSGLRTPITLDLLLLNSYYSGLRTLLFSPSGCWACAARPFACLYNNISDVLCFHLLQVFLFTLLLLLLVSVCTFPYASLSNH